MKKFVFTALATGCFATVVFAATTLTPNTNHGNGGNIPSGYDDLNFSVGDGNYASYITLPKTGTNGAKVTISSSASYNSTLDTSNTDFIAGGYTITKGDSLSFTFNSTQGIWNLLTPEKFSPKTSGSTVPNFTGLAAQYQVSNGDWVPQINLPQSAKDHQIILIKSDADNAASINSANALFTSTLTVKKGDKYYLQYYADIKQWVPVDSPTRVINVINGNSTQLNMALANLTAPKTEVKLANAAWVPNVTLPKSANDRDRIIVTSTAAWQSTIDNTNTNNTATFKINKGDRYEFMYVADQATWVLTSSPKPVVQANKSASQLNAVKTPVTEIYADNTSWAANVTLPTTAQNNDKIVVNSDADSSFSVTANGLVQKINKGDTIRFVYDGSTWKADTAQIDILLVDSPEVDAKLGATAAKLNMREGIRVTNGALENSQAKAYFREVGYINYIIPGGELNAVLSAARSDQTVQNELSRLGADAIHYQGAEPQSNGCGVGYVNSVPNKLNMISVSRMDCPEQVISHELGHNLGLLHSFQRAKDEIQRDKDIAAGKPRAPLDYNYGFEHPLVGTLLSYKFVPVRIAYYSSPKIYDPKYGLRIGETDKVDAVRRIDQNALAFSNFRTAIN